MLTCGTGPEPAKPLPADHWLTRLVEFHDRTVNAVTALDRIDADVPMLLNTVAEIESRRMAYQALYDREHVRCSHLASMIVAAVKRAAQHEDDVRRAMADGSRLPEAPVVGLVEKIIAESRAARDVAFPAVEEAGKAYQKACTVAAGCRALLARLMLEPSRLAAEAVLQQVREVDSRVEIAAGMLDAPRLEIAFRREGLL